MGHIQIGQRQIGPGRPVYVIAELSANHHQKFENAVRLVELARQCGADAVKLQTYTPDTITLKSDGERFRVGGGTVWDGRTLFDLYTEAYTPWEWQPKLKHLADDLGLDLFSSPFDNSAVDFLEAMQVAAYKVASCELVDLPLIERMARTGKPLIISTGMATLEEIEEAVAAAERAGAKQIALLKCTTAYPADPREMNLRTIPELANRFRVPVGLSDHTLSTTVPVAAVALGANLIEKHLTLSRSMNGPDDNFSLEPEEFKVMVDTVRLTERALGEVQFGPTESEKNSRRFRRSLFVVENIRRGDTFDENNVRSIRPGDGLHTRYLSDVVGRSASQDIERGTPLSWDLVVKS